MISKLSKVSDSIYQGPYSVGKSFELIEKFKNFCSVGAKVVFLIWFAAQKSPFLIEIQTIFNPECLETNLSLMIRFIKIFILLSELLNRLVNSRKFVGWVQKLRFFVIIRVTEITISH
jgi:hypothetical protein